MRRFRFPLARVHRWRAQQERMARRALAGSIAELSQVERRLAEVRDGIAACRDEERGTARALAHAVERGLSVSARALQARWAVAAKAVEQAQNVYRQRRRDLHAITRLHEARQQAWEAEQQAAEQQEIEETTRMRAWTPKRGVRS